MQAIRLFHVFKYTRERMMRRTFYKCSYYPLPHFITHLCPCHGVILVHACKARGLVRSNLYDSGSSDVGKVSKIQQNVPLEIDIEIW